MSSTTASHTAAEEADICWLTYLNTVYMGGTTEQRAWAFKQWSQADDNVAALQRAGDKAKAKAKAETAKAS